MTIEQMRNETLGYDEHFNKDDFDTVAAHPCDRCHLKLTYKGFKKGDSYRAFFVCYACGYAEEF